MRLFYCITFFITVVLSEEVIASRLEFLKKHTGPIEVVKEYWATTFKKRETYLKSKGSSIAAYVQSYPVLRITERAKELVSFILNICYR